MIALKPASKPPKTKPEKNNEANLSFVRGPVMDLKNKNILIITPFFFEYHERIRTALTDRGANVDLVDDKPSHTVFARTMMRLDVPLYHAAINRYYDKVMASLRPDYDFILFIKCEVPTIEVLKKFRKKYPYAQQLLYLWDSVANIKHITAKFAYFNRIFSFDPGDVSRYSFLEYAYWGYTKEFDRVEEEAPVWDICFVGTLHSVRPAVLEAVKSQCQSMGLNFYQFVYLPHPLVFWYNKLFNPLFRDIPKNQVHFKPLSVKETIDIYRKSKAVLEVENVHQSGATTRLGEMLGMRKKIITTFNCRDADFYRPENQLVIDPDDLHLKKDFFTVPYVSIPEEVRAQYSFEHFIDTVFSE